MNREGFLHAAAGAAITDMRLQAAAYARTRPALPAPLIAIGQAAQVVSAGIITATNIRANGAVVTK